MTDAESVPLLHERVHSELFRGMVVVGTLGTRNRLDGAARLQLAVDLHRARGRVASVVARTRPHRRRDRTVAGRACVPGVAAHGQSARLGGPTDRRVATRAVEARQADCGTANGAGHGQCAAGLCWPRAGRFGAFYTRTARLVYN